MREAGVLLDAGGEPIYWHAPSNRSAVYLPDSRELWDVIWENRARASAFAHSHPGSGLPEPSCEDLTTFLAIERGLGKRLSWPIVTSDWTRIFVRREDGVYESNHAYYKDRSEPEWVAELRRISE